ncbi:MAG TPA: hypothetical protein VFX42_07040 [Gemmatimonadales bacterium]|nr:hypothetical protein [Gemmatimonadales bacterium]
MIARPTDITQTGASAADVPAAETPLQRQILLWQRELVRRGEAGKRGSGEV